MECCLELPLSCTTCHTLVLTCACWQVQSWSFAQASNILTGFLTRNDNTDLDLLRHAALYVYNLALQRRVDTEGTYNAAAAMEDASQLGQGLGQPTVALPSIDSKTMVRQRDKTYVAAVVHGVFAFV